MKLAGIVLFLCFVHLAFAQVNIEGKLTDKNQESIVGAHIRLSAAGFERFTYSDAEGRFSFRIEDNRQPEGGFKLDISAIGYERYVRNVNIDELKTPIAIEMNASTVELETVEILGRKPKDYRSNYSFSATKIAIENKYLPQAISAVTKELIADRQAFNLSDVVKVVSSVTPSSFYNQHAIRGISQNEGGQIINGMRTRQFYFTQPLTSNIERVEVIKGPSSVTFSSVDPGGSINMVTKKPLREKRKSISLGAGSFNTIRGSIDFTGPLNSSKTLLYRFNGAYQEAGSFRDLIKNRSILISPSFSYVPNEHTRANAEIIYSDVNGYLDRGQPIFGAIAGQTNLNSSPTSLNLGRPNDFFVSKEFIFTASLAQRLAKNSVLNIRYMKQTWTEDLQEHRSTNAFATDIAGNELPNLVQMRMVKRQQFWDTDNVNAYVDYDLDIGPIKNKLLVGYDFQSWEKAKGSGQNQARGFILADGSATRRFDPARASDYQTIEMDGVTLPKPNVDYFNLDAPDNAIANINDYVINSQFAIPPGLSTVHAVYIQDQLSWRKFKLLLSLRHEWFEDIINFGESDETSYFNNRLIPRVGLTYTINDHINVYGTYLEGFQPQSNTTDLMPNTEGFLWNASTSAASFDPLISNLIEVGAKVELAQKRLLINAAIYQITQKNILLGDPYNIDALVQRGADRSRGFEVDVTGYVTDNWQIYASYAYIDAEIRDDNDRSLIGQRKENTPVHSGNLWTRYNFAPSSALKWLGIGFGMTAQGSRIPWFTRDFETPGFVTFDGALYYTPMRSNIQLALNVNNLLDEKYWVGAQTYTRLFPGAPRNFMVSLTYKF